jgi:hypothetical protein
LFPIPVSIKIIGYHLQLINNVLHVNEVVGIGWIGFVPNSFGTTPNIAPPSNLKLPVSIGYNFIIFLFF